MTKKSETSIVSFRQSSHFVSSKTSTSRTSFLCPKMRSNVWITYKIPLTMRVPLSKKRNKSSLQENKTISSEKSLKPFETQHWRNFLLSNLAKFPASNSKLVSIASSKFTLTNQDQNTGFKHADRLKKFFALQSGKIGPATNSKMVSIVSSKYTLTNQDQKTAFDQGTQTDWRNFWLSKLATLVLRLIQNWWVSFWVNLTWPIRTKWQVSTKASISTLKCDLMLPQIREIRILPDSSGRQQSRWVV